MKKVLIILALLAAGYFAFKQLGASGIEGAGEDVAAALCTSPDVLARAQKHFDDQQLVGATPSASDVRSLCDAFFAAVEDAGHKKSRALVTLGPGGRDIWEGTIAPHVASTCPSAGSPRAVGFLAANLLACVAPATSEGLTEQQRTDHYLKGMDAP